jgi:hypothetical protein
MRFLFLISFFLLIFEVSFAESWTGLSSCGHYLVMGTVHINDKGPVIVVNEKSLSEIMITVPIQNEIFLAPYDNQSIEAIVEFSKKFSFSKVQGIVKKIKYKTPNPLNPNDSKIKLISAARCK